MPHCQRTTWSNNSDPKGWSKCFLGMGTHGVHMCNNPLLRYRITISFGIPRARDAQTEGTIFFARRQVAGRLLSMWAEFPMHERALTRMRRACEPTRTPYVRTCIPCMPMCVVVPMHKACRPRTQIGRTHARPSNQMCVQHIIGPNTCPAGSCPMHRPNMLLDPRVGQLSTSLSLS